MKLVISIGYIKDELGNGAASVIRTRDLTLTKGALYRWSYGSILLASRPVQITFQGRGGVFCRKFVTGTNSLAQK